MKIVFFGTPEFAVASLQAILEAGYEVAAVVTTPDRIGGRGKKVIESDVKKFAVSAGLNVLQPEKLRNREFIQTLEKINADLFVVIAFRMLPEIVWKIPRLGTFNLHASLLPDLRGAAPINHAIISGKKKTGVTTFFINEEIDKGNILLKAETDILPEENAGSLHDRLMEMGSELVVKTIRELEQGELTATPQPKSEEFTPAPKIFKDTCKLDFNKSAVEIDRLIRGLSPYPGAWTVAELEDGKVLELKVFASKPLESENKLEPGSTLKSGKRLLVGTGDGELELLSVQPAGKRRMEVKEFLAGYTPVRFQ